MTGPSPDHDADPNQANKALVWAYWRDLDGAAGAGPARLTEVATAAMAPDAPWHGHAPVGSLTGPVRFVESAWAPLVASFPDLRRETFLFFGGRSNGRVDGDASLDNRWWVTGTGVLRGTFAADYLTIPATGTEVAIRWGEFCCIDEGRIVETFFLIDVVDLMRQAGFEVLPPSRGIDGRYPRPAADDGILLDPQDHDVSDHSLAHIRRFIFDGLNEYDQTDLASMGMADFFEPDVCWYGPGGIGACLGLDAFEDHHQRPWLVAFPDRRVQDLDALIAEGSYSGAPGWAGVLATHTGLYLDVAATGRPIAFNGLDWWKRQGERYIENWVFVDMVHLFDQFGVDLFERLRPSAPSH
ncbi:MAG: ester cyclase [Actinomycetota bacterium]